MGWAARLNDTVDLVRRGILKPLTAEQRAERKAAAVVHRTPPASKREYEWADTYGTRLVTRIVAGKKKAKSVRVVRGACLVRKYPKVKGKANVKRAKKARRHARQSSVKERAA